jgi:hypothetical protein
MTICIVYLWHAQKAKTTTNQTKTIKDYLDGSNVQKSREYLRELSQSQERFFPKFIRNCYFLRSSSIFLFFLRSSSIFLFSYRSSYISYFKFKRNRKKIFFFLSSSIFYFFLGRLPFFIFVEVVFQFLF